MLLARAFNGEWLLHLLDILLVAIITYQGLVLLKRAMAYRIALALTILLASSFIAGSIGLQTLDWLLEHFFDALVVIVIIIFQGDIRRALHTVTRKSFPRSEEQEEGREESQEVIDELVAAATTLAGKRIGALVVIERVMSLDNLVPVGTEIDAKVASELITSIFLPYSPIHDGAVIIRKGKLTRAGCFLPLTQNPEVARELGTRHRAAIGLTEMADAVVVVVSEETGQISLSVDGRISRDLDPAGLRRQLLRLVEPRWLS